MSERQRASFRRHLGRVALYRLFNEHGVLLYIGIAREPEERFTAHWREKWWWNEVDESKTTLEWIEFRKVAHFRERQAIDAENPRYNLLRGVPYVETEDVG